jgi:hypothetical protein
LRDSDGTLRHFYSVHPRLADEIKERGIDEWNPIWNVLDLTPQEGGSWYASLDYRKKVKAARGWRIEGVIMPEKETLERAAEDKAEGKSPSTQAGEFVHEEIEHIREGKHGARSTKQAIAIGLSKARRAGVKLLPSKETREQGRSSLNLRFRRPDQSTEAQSCSARRLVLHGLSVCPYRPLVLSS